MSKHSHSSKHSFPPFTLGKNLDLALGVTAAAIAGDQFLRATDKTKRNHHHGKHQLGHYAAAVTSGVMAVGAFGMLYRDRKDKKREQEQARRHRHDREESPSRGRSDEESADEDDHRHRSNHRHHGPRWRSASPRYLEDRAHDGGHRSASRGWLLTSPDRRRRLDEEEREGDTVWVLSPRPRARSFGGRAAEHYDPDMLLPEGHHSRSRSRPAQFSPVRRSAESVHRH